MTRRWPKDLLSLIFWEIESGYDMLKFGEISRRCNQIFHNNLIVIKTINCKTTCPRTYMRKRVFKQKHGLYKSWGYLPKQLFSEANIFHGKLHGIHREWYPTGQLEKEEKWHHGHQIEN